jgi:hypothetical protein
MTKHVVVSQAEPIEDLANVSFRGPRMADYEGWDLQHLGTEFDRLYAEWMTLRNASDEAHSKWMEEVKAKGIHPDRDKKAFWALENEIRANAVKLSNDALDALTPVTELIRSAPTLSVHDIAVKLRVLRFEMAVHDDEPREDQDWDDQCMNGLIDEVHALSAVAAEERMSFAAIEFKRAAAEVYPHHTNWTLWEGKQTTGSYDVFFTLTGKGPVQ